MAALTSAVLCLGALGLLWGECTSRQVAGELGGICTKRGCAGSNPMVTGSFLGLALKQVGLGATGAG